MSDSAAGLRVEGLRVGLRGDATDLLRDVSFSVEPGEIVGLVGESGSGKTVASLTLLGLQPPVMEVRGGTVRLGERVLYGPGSEHVVRSARDIAMIFQQPQAALNPTMRIGAQLARVLKLHQGRSRAEVASGVIDLLGRVGIAGPERVARAYPHQLSGGMCQRAMIALALACRPRILVADEPTTALDVTIQAQVFDLITTLVSEEGCGVVLISHDLGVVSEVCDRVNVLYGGQLMEAGPVRAVLDRPRHPYTRFLLDAVEREVDPNEPDAGVNFRLRGCRFGHRCAHADDACAEFPPLLDRGDGHVVSCVRPLTEAAR